MTAADPAIARLLRKAEIDPGAAQIAPGPEGGNNRISVITCAGRRWIAKSYFADGTGKAERLHREWRFLTYAYQAGIGCVPRPIACDEDERIALYAFVDGTKPGPGDISQDDVLQAAHFAAALNAPALRAAARDLPDAAEACFSLESHLAMVDGRLARLTAADCETDTDREAAQLVALLRDGWRDRKAGLKAGWRALGRDEAEPLPAGARCVSPSDFGFHNAIQRADGTFVFVDFEYAGRDDPAKMVCDFFLQPAVPVDRRHFEPFARHALGWMDDPEITIESCRLLFPAFAIKWCCIILNPFVRTWTRRSDFARGATDLSALKRERLARAVALSRKLDIEAAAI